MRASISWSALGSLPLEARKSEENEKKIAENLKKLAKKKKKGTQSTLHEEIHKKVNIKKKSGFVSQKNCKNLARAKETN